MKKYFVVFLTSIFTFTLFSCKKEEFTFKVESMIGTVKISSEQGERVPWLGDTVALGETVVTGDKSVCDLMYGKVGVLRVSDNSTVKITALQEKIAGNAELNLDGGVLHATLAKLSKNSEFKIKTPTTVVAVRGTSFRVSSDAKTQTSRLDVIAGEVNMKPVKDGKVIEEVTVKVESGKAAELDSKKVEKIAEQIAKKLPAEKIEILVIVLKQEEIRKIQDEVKDIKPEILDRLDPIVKKEYRKEILNIKEEEKPDKKKEDDEKQKKEEADKKLKDDANSAKLREAALEKARRDREEQDRLAKEKADKERADKDKAEQERIEKEKAEKARLEAEKKKKERAGNVPTM